MRITKEHMLTAINQLPADATIEDALEALTTLCKISNGLQQDGRMSQREVELHFQQR